MWTVQDFAEQIGGFRREVAGIARRMLVKLTDGTTWQVSGHALFDPTRPETRDVEQWPGIGVFARPPGDAEAIVLNVGGQNNPQIVATRDEATRAAAVADTAGDESNLYNSKARVHVKAGGTVEIVGVPQILSPESMVKGDSYLTAEQTLFTAVDVFASLMSTDPTFSAAYPAIAAGAATLVAAFTAFFAVQATFRARVGKVE